MKSLNLLDHFLHDPDFYMSDFTTCAYDNEIMYVRLHVYTLGPGYINQPFSMSRRNPSWRSGHH